MIFYIWLWLFHTYSSTIYSSFFRINCDLYIRPIWRVWFLFRLAAAALYIVSMLGDSKSLFLICNLLFDEVLLSKLVYWIYKFLIGIKNWIRYYVYCNVVGDPWRTYELFSLTIMVINFWSVHFHHFSLLVLKVFSIKVAGIREKDGKAKATLVHFEEISKV